MTPVQKTKWKRAGLIALLAFSVSALSHALDWLEGAEHSSWDLRARLLADPEHASNQIALIMIDQPSLDWAQDVNATGWPWPREFYVMINAFAQRAGAKGVIYDLLFLEDSVYGVGDDQNFATAMQGIPTYLASYPEDRPINALRTASRALGNVAQQPDTDGIYRSLQVFPTGNPQGMAALGLVPWLTAQPTSVSIEFTPEYISMGKVDIPLNAQGRALLNFHGPLDVYPIFSAAQIIQSELRLSEQAAGGSTEGSVLDPAELKDKYIFIGTDAPGLFDLRPTPVSPVYPGVGIHATFLDNLLNGGFIIQQPNLHTYLFSTACVLLAVLSLSFIPSILHSALLTLALLLVPLTAAALAWLNQHGWNVSTPTLGMLLAASGVFLSNYQLEGRERRFIRSAFQQYLSPQVIEQLVKNPAALQLGGERRELSIFFSDLEGFSRLAERLDPRELSDFLNHYLSEMSDIILASGGTIDKYEGDAIIAFWNAPLPCDDHAARAVKAGLQCQQRLQALQPQYRQWLGDPVNARIGIHTGTAVVGNMGSSKRFDYTMLGDAVNLASRLEGVNKVFSSRLLISEQTFNQAGQPKALHRVGTVQVVGRDTPVRVYAPVPPYYTEAQKEQFQQALICFEQGNFVKAGEGFAALTANDPVAESLFNYIKQLETPPADWSGVIMLTQK